LNDWSFANCRTVSEDEASVYLGYRVKSGGILFVGATTQFQFRPDKAVEVENDGKKKAPKYRTPLGEYDAFLPGIPDIQTIGDRKLRESAISIDAIPIC
jgi:putative DNA primase/helicase